MSLFRYWQHVIRDARLHRPEYRYLIRLLDVSRALVLLSITGAYVYGLWHIIYGAPAVLTHVSEPASLVAGLDSNEEQPLVKRLSLNQKAIRDQATKDSAVFDKSQSFVLSAASSNNALVVSSVSKGYLATDSGSIRSTDNSNSPVTTAVLKSVSRSKEIRQIRKQAESSGNLQPDTMADPL